MKRTSIILLVVAVAITTFLVTRLRNSRTSSASVGESPPGLAGQKAPDFELQSLDGKTVHLSDFRGKAVLLNFWATWCQPCKIEMPWFEQLQKQYAQEGLQVIGVAMDDDVGKDDIAKFTKKLGVDYPILLGKESVGDAYGGVQFLPATFYVARDGKVVEKVFGLKGRDEIEGNVKKALGLSVGVAGGGHFVQAKGSAKVGAATMRVESTSALPEPKQ